MAHSSLTLILARHYNVAIFQQLHRPIANSTSFTMSTILQQMRAKYAAQAKSQPKGFGSLVYTTYTSLPVPVPDDFLAPLPDPSVISVKKIDFATSPLPEYRRLFAVVLDNVLSQSECDELLKMAEMSAGAHGNAGPGKVVEQNGWKPAMVNAGRNHEVLALDYRNSDRIIWDEGAVTRKLWDRVLQGEGMKEYFGVLDGEEYVGAIGPSATMPGERWVVTKQGLNERMRFLRYGPAQYFKEHCDGTYETPDGCQRSFYTYHIYLNDSAQALGIVEGSEEDKANPDLLRGGATTFWAPDGKRRLDVDPKAGRVLIFQHRRLLHSGDEVTQGTKFTVRSDVMYEYEAGSNGDDDGGIIFE